MSELNTPLKPSELAQAIQTCFQAHRAPMLHGDPGVGKSDLVLQAADAMFADAYDCNVKADYTVWTRPGKQQKAKQLGANERPWFIDFRTALHDAVDLTGVPFVEGGVTRWATPEILPTDPRGGVFFMDEINRGAEMTRNATFSLALDGRIGKYRMPEKWVVAAAVNDKDLGAAKMSAALTRRFAHLNCATDLEDVCRYAIKRNWEPVVIAYLRMFPMDLNEFDPKERVSPNPRAWEFISQMVAQNSVNKRVEHSLFAGVVGDDRAVKFSAFLRMYRSMPSIDAIMLNPAKADVPTESGVLYAISAALARRAQPENFGRIMTYVERMPVEFQTFMVKDSVTRDQALQHTAAFTKWGVVNQSVTL